MLFEELPAEDRRSSALTRPTDTSGARRRGAGCRRCVPVVADEGRLPAPLLIADVVLPAPWDAPEPSVALTLSAGGYGQGPGDTFKNPVTGEEHQAQIVLPYGFIWQKDAAWIVQRQSRESGLVVRGHKLDLLPI